MCTLHHVRIIKLGKGLRPRPIQQGFPPLLESLWVALGPGRVQATGYVSLICGSFSRAAAAISRRSPTCCSMHSSLLRPQPLGLSYPPRADNEPRAAPRERVDRRHVLEYSEWRLRSNAAPAARRAHGFKLAGFPGYSSNRAPSGLVVPESAIIAPTCRSPHWSRREARQKGAGC